MGLAMRGSLPSGPGPSVQRVRSVGSAVGLSLGLIAMSFHVPLHLEAFGEHGAEHTAEGFVVDEVAGGEVVDGDVVSGLGDDVEFIGVKPFGGVGDALLVAGVEIPTEGDQKHEGDGAGLDLVAGDAAVARLIGLAGFDGGNFEWGGWRFREGFSDIGGVRCRRSQGRRRGLWQPRA